MLDSNNYFPFVLVVFSRGRGKGKLSLVSQFNFTLILIVLSRSRHPDTVPNHLTWQTVIVYELILCPDKNMRVCHL